MYSWRAIGFIILFTITIPGIKSEDDEASIKTEDSGSDNGDDPESQPEVDPVPYVSPDIDSSVYFADHFDSDETFEKKWIKSSAKKGGVEAAIDR